MCKYLNFHEYCKNMSYKEMKDLLTSHPLLQTGNLFKELVLLTTSIYDQSTKSFKQIIHIVSNVVISLKWQLIMYRFCLLKYVFDFQLYVVKNCCDQWNSWMFLTISIFIRVIVLYKVQSVKNKKRETVLLYSNPYPTPQIKLYWCILFKVWSFIHKLYL